MIRPIGSDGLIAFLAVFTELFRPRFSDCPRFLVSLGPFFWAMLLPSSHVVCPTTVRFAGFHANVFPQTNLHPREEAEVVGRKSFPWIKRRQPLVVLLADIFLAYDYEGKTS